MDRLKHEYFIANVNEYGVDAWVPVDPEPDSRTAMFFILCIGEAIIQGFGVEV